MQLLLTFPISCWCLPDFFWCIYIKRKLPSFFLSESPLFGGLLYCLSVLFEGSFLYISVGMFFFIWCSGSGFWFWRRKPEATSKTCGLTGSLSKTTWYCLYFLKCHYFIFPLFSRQKNYNTILGVFYFIFWNDKKNQNSPLFIYNVNKNRFFSIKKYM